MPGRKRAHTWLPIGGCLPCSHCSCLQSPTCTPSQFARSQASSQFETRIVLTLQAILKSRPSLLLWPGLTTCGYILVPSAPFRGLQRSGHIWAQHVSLAFLPPVAQLGGHDCKKSICSAMPVASFDVFHHSERQDAGKAQGGSGQHPLAGSGTCCGSGELKATLSFLLRGQKRLGRPRSY